MRKLFLMLALLVASTLSAQQTPAGDDTPMKDKVQIRWDLLARYDRIEEIPRLPVNRSFNRSRIQFRPGLLFTPVPMASIEVRAALRADTEENEFYKLVDGTFKTAPGFSLHQHLRYTGRSDNFAPNSIRLDRLNLQLRPNESSNIFFGRFQDPFDTTEAMWDPDLQAQGLAGSYTLGQAAGFHSRMTGGVYLNTQMYGDRSVISAAQYTAMTSEQWPVTLTVSASYHDFDDLEVLATRNFRSNQTVELGGGKRKFLSQYRIGDVLVRIHSDRWKFPAEVYYDGIRNFGAKSLRDGLEAGIKLGQLAGAGTFRVSYIFQDLQRDAVMDGFNGDDWYLHSWYRGSLYRLGVGIWRDFAVQGTYVRLRHLETNFDTTRWMVDLVKRF
ncbi:MAG TPA: putative porin [Thermoanaerobaculia bacterium]|nr:putative porin [Thermoanaerobaculia bacterium]